MVTLSIFQFDTRRSEICFRLDYSETQQPEQNEVSERPSVEKEAQQIYVMLCRAFVTR